MPTPPDDILLNKAAVNERGIATGFCWARHLACQFARK